jgi:hypothetical protein
VEKYKFGGVFGSPGACFEGFGFFGNVVPKALTT